MLSDPSAQEEEIEELLSSHRVASNSISASTPHFARYHDHREIMSTRLGLIRAYWLGALLNFAGFQFGYDSGMAPSQD